VVNAARRYAAQKREEEPMQAYGEVNAVGRAEEGEVQCVKCKMCGTGVESKQGTKVVGRVGG